MFCDFIVNFIYNFFKLNKKFKHIYSIKYTLYIKGKINFILIDLIINSMLKLNS